MSVLLLTATPLEQNRLVAELSEPVHASVNGRSIHHGLCAGRQIDLVETGIGAVNTAHALTRTLEAKHPEFVLQVGVAGAYGGSGLQVGDLAVAAEEVYGDLGVITPAGWRAADEIGIPVVHVGGRDLFNRFPTDVEMGRRAVDLLRVADRTRVEYGPFITVQACSGSATTGAQREAIISGALCESMEGAAAAHVCALYDVPFVEIRAISNAVEDRDLSRWDLPLASHRAQEAALCLLQETYP
ncbi:MAG TPA: futalosine hydrolase [Candidatus Latescibacteria bacterium]|jgi:futalosine hydrolase|nr:futalosine hydrolase [Candidatus Latescibacterota bacterium]